jgi:DNA primase
VVHYPVCDDRETLLWFANQRAVEYHPTLFRELASDAPTHLVVDLDPPAGSDAFAQAVQAAFLVRQALSDAGTASMVKTSGAKGVHVVVPLAPGQSAVDAAAATRALAARAERLDPVLTTTAFVVEERGGKVFLDATRAVGRPSWPRTARGPGPARRCRCHWRGRTWRTRPPPTSASPPCRAAG